MTGIDTKQNHYQNENKIWLEKKGQGPIVATAIHAGHKIRRELLPLLALDEANRAREEDPYTDYWARVVPTWLVPTQSRFEIDLNRQPETAIYLTPELAWNLHVWQTPPGPADIKRSLDEYDAFYKELEKLLEDMAQQHKYFVILDLHAYNYRRAGSTAAPANPKTNPEVNIGTGTLYRQLFGALVERFMEDLREFDFPGHHLDVRENVKFEGRQLAEWIHRRFPESACVLSVEFKKFYMDEWTGVGDIELIQAIRDALQSTLPGILEELQKLQ